MNEDHSRNGLEFESTLTKMPREAGVYLMKDRQGRIIYVGKAKSLRNRVRSYFAGGKDPKTTLLVRHVAGIDYIVTHNEYEALVLENNLIKAHTPRYNINLKDGKSYPVVRITSEEYPRVFRTRRIMQDGSEYFGPFPSVRSLDTYLDLIERLFPLRRCRGPIRKRNHPCLYHHIGRCAGLCAGRISRDDYLKNVDGVRALLSGRTEELRNDLAAKMGAAGEELRFEKAAEYRDAIRSIEDLESRQAVEDFDAESRDFVAWACEVDLVSVVVLEMRGGKLVGRNLYRGHAAGLIEDTVRQFLTQYYSTRPDAPARIVTRERLTDRDLNRFLDDRFERTVSLGVPASGRERATMAMAVENADHDLRRRVYEQGDLRALEDLKDVVGLSRVPVRIEGFDISQLSGKFPVASMVSFFRGAPDRKSYRRFHVKTLDGRIDDFEAIREIVARRYTRVVNEGLERPDLVVIDGGRGQLSAAKAVLGGLGLAEVPVIGLAKRNEEIYLPDKPDPVVLPSGSSALRIIQAVRDEAHRFATGFNRKLRGKAIALSNLERVPGVGPRRSRRILEHFGSVPAIAAAPVYEVAQAGGLSLEVAEAVRLLAAGGATGEPET